MTPAPGATTIVPSSPASRPRPPGGLRPALTPAAGDTGMHRSGAGNKEDQQNKIHLTEVSTVSGDCQCAGQCGSPLVKRAADRDREVQIALVHATLSIAASMPPNVYNTITQERTTP